MPRAVVVLAMLAVLFGAAPALADECQEEEILIRFDGNVFGREGDVVQVAMVAVDAHLVGATCIGTATVENNSSAHPGNDFIITSGGTQRGDPGLRTHRRKGHHGELGAGARRVDHRQHPPRAARRRQPGRGYGRCRLGLPAAANHHDDPATSHDDDAATGLDDDAATGHDHDGDADRRCECWWWWGR